MRMPLLSGEQLIKEGFSNLQRGWEALGGRLYLTDQRLIFGSHPFNIQRGSAVIP
jgi:GRAM domain